MLHTHLRGVATHLAGLAYHLVAVLALCMIGAMLGCRRAYRALVAHQASKTNAISRLEDTPQRVMSKVTININLQG